MSHVTLYVTRHSGCHNLQDLVGFLKTTTFGYSAWCNAVYVNASAVTSADMNTKSTTRLFNNYLPGIIAVIECKGCKGCKGVRGVKGVRV